MPDVKPRPRAGAIRLSLMRADQKGTGSASVLVSSACTPGPRVDSRLAPEAYSHAHVSTASLRPSTETPKPRKSWSMIGALGLEIELRRHMRLSQQRSHPLDAPGFVFHRREIRRQATRSMSEVGHQRRSAVITVADK